MDRNTTIGLALCAAIFIGYQILVAPSKEELRSLLGTPDPTRRISLDEIERNERREAAERERVENAEPELLRRRMINPTSEVAIASRAAARGAHAAGVQFSAARRKPRTTYFFVRGEKLELGHDGLGGPPKPARGPRALPVPISEFGFNSMPVGAGLALIHSSLAGG